MPIFLEDFFTYFQCKHGQKSVEVLSQDVAWVTHELALIWTKERFEKNTSLLMLAFREISVI